MNPPILLSLEALLEEDGMCVTAGLPEGLRRELDQLAAARKRVERAEAEREHLAKLLAKVVELETRIQDTERELAAVLREYATRRAAIEAGTDAA